MRDDSNRHRIVKKNVGTVHRCEPSSPPSLLLSLLAHLIRLVVTVAAWIQFDVRATSNKMRWEKRNDHLINGNEKLTTPRLLLLLSNVVFTAPPRVTKLLLLLILMTGEWAVSMIGAMQVGTASKATIVVKLQQTYLCYDSCAGSGILIIVLHEHLPWVCDVWCCGHRWK